MAKGKFGISLSVVAAVAFAFAALRQPVAVLLVAGFALLAEKDEWLNRQTLQSLFLTIAYYLVVLANDLVLGGMAQFFRLVGLTKIHSAINTLNTALDDIIYAAFIVACVIAVLRVLLGKDAGLPLLSKLAGGPSAAAGKPQAKTQTPPAANAQPAAPAHAPAPAPAKTPPATAQSGKTAPPVKFCSSCGAALTGDSVFCTECGTKQSN